MTSNSPSSLVPHIATLLKGEKLQDISFVEYPPAKWSWHLARAMAAAIMDPGTKQYWETSPEKNLQERATYLGQVWARRSKINLELFPEIFPHATALFESMVLRSQPAMGRLYGTEGAKVGHYVAQGLMSEGIEQYPKWFLHYYEMRQSIETDDTLQNHLNQYVSMYPHGWNQEQETRYQYANQNMWPLLPIHPAMESSMEWFNPTSMAVVPIRTVIKSHSQSLESIDEIDGTPYEGLKMGKQGSVQIEGLLGQHHEVAYQFNLLLTPAPVAGSHPLHVDIVIERSTELTDDLSLQQMHAMALAHAITKSLGAWLSNPIIKERTTLVRFEPSVHVDCQLRDPEANLVWLDIVQEHVQQFLAESFNLPSIETSIRRTM